MVVEIILGFSIIGCLIESYVIWNLMKKTELLETWVEAFTRRIEYIQEDLKNIDSTGHFESDDEIGTIFQQIKSTLEQLNELKGV
tara:strand:- start:639 stop:893 length:255 start_codon:yes stop_codon:yes gene_type:complete